MKQKHSSDNRKYNVRWLLVFYDLCIYAFFEWGLMFAFPGTDDISTTSKAIHCLISFAAVFCSRFAFDIYRQVWRYGGIQSYIRLFVSDGTACIVYYILQFLLPIDNISLARILSIFNMNLLTVLSIRMVYRYAYRFANRPGKFHKLLHRLVKIFTGVDMKTTGIEDKKRIKIAIVGAGRVGTGLAEELLNNPSASYIPRCFIDVNKEKVGRKIYGVPVFSEETVSFERLEQLEIQEIVFALPQMDAEAKKAMYEYYKKSGCKIKVYDYPTIPSAGNQKRLLREFDIEELLFRAPITVSDERTGEYYKDKTVLITGGGGSIGSELCRQIAKMQPKKLIILDVYENGAYDVQQELKIAYGNDLDVCVEIISVCNRHALDRVFAAHRPQIVLNAAAHKHVPLMEHNAVEAIENNIFGTLNTVEVSEKYGVERLIMISTDKAVNPTNVMGATKRFCEMIVQSHSQSGTATTFSATRFGNVLGSAGSVIPLFKRQIAHGGPITLTDRRIIRYFMTIPEASQLVLQSGAIAKNGDLFVLDMGQPVKILTLAENMIRLSGLEPGKDIEIIETGLRPGEKLYEELLVKSEELDKTENSLIFIERDAPLPLEEIEHKIEILRRAVESGSNDEAIAALHKVVPTFKKMDEVNREAEKSKEMAQVGAG